MPSINPIYDPEQERIIAQLKLADALRQQGMTAKAVGSGGAGMVGNLFVKGNQMGNLAQVLGGAGLDAYARNQADKLGASRDAERQQFMAEMPSGVDTQRYDPVANPGTGPLVDGMEVPKDPRALAQATQAWAMKAPRGMEGVQNFALQQAMTAPQRQAETEARAADRMQELQLRAMDARATAAERFAAQKEIAQMQIDARKDMAHLAASLRPAPAPHTSIAYGPDGKGYLVDMRTGAQTPLQDVGKAPKAPSANDLKAEKLAGASGRIANIIDEASKNAESFGIVPSVASMLPNAVGSRVTSMALKEPQRIARANVMRQAAQEIHDLYGAALSRGEAGRANSFAPNPNDDYDTIMSKLKSAKQYADSIKPGAASAPTSPSGGRRKYNPATGDFE